MAKRKKPNIDAFCTKWERKFFAAISKVIEYIREEDSSFQIDGPYSMCDEDTVVFGFSVRKGKGRRGEEFLDVWVKLEPVYDEDPLEFWPLLSISEADRGEIRSFDLSDSLVELHDRESIEFVIENIADNRQGLFAYLKDYPWPRPEGVLDWRPEDEDPQSPSMGATKEYLKFATPLALDALEEVAKYLTRAGRVVSAARPYLTGDAVWFLYQVAENQIAGYEIALFHLSNTDRPEIRFFNYLDRNLDGTPKTIFQEDLWEHPINRKDFETTKKMFKRVKAHAKTIADVFLDKTAPRRSVLDWRPGDEEKPSKGRPTIE